MLIVSSLQCKTKRFTWWTLNQYNQHVNMLIYICIASLNIDSIFTVNLRLDAPQSLTVKIPRELTFTEMVGDNNTLRHKQNDPHFRYNIFQCILLNGTYDISFLNIPAICS